MEKKVKNLASIGRPLKCTEYKIADNGELWVRGKTMASRIIQNGEERITDFDEWFNTHDLATEKDGVYFLHGRRDDLVVCRNGENLNPEILENAIYVKGVNRLCLFADTDGAPTLIISVTDCFDPERIKKIHGAIIDKLRENNLVDEIERVVLTSDKLLAPEDFKLSRRKVARRFANSEYKLIDLQNTEEHVEHMLSQLEKNIIECFAEALAIDKEKIQVTSDFFTDLGGSSLNYFALVDLLKTRYGIDPSVTENNNLVTVRDFCKYIENQKK
jgi:acyl carrier protein